MTPPPITAAITESNASSMRPIQRHPKKEVNYKIVLTYPQFYDYFVVRDGGG
jgi:hypothetical protein